MKPKEIIYLHIGRKVRALRQAAGLTQAELAKSIEGELGRTSIVNLEQGRQAIPLDRLVEIGLVLGVTDWNVLLPPLSKKLQQRIDPTLFDKAVEKAYQELLDTDD